MIGAKLRRCLLTRRLALAALVAVPLLAADAYAQSYRGGGRQGGGAARQPPRPRDPRSEPKRDEPGIEDGFIMRFTPAKPEEEDLIGYLSFRPARKDARTLKLRIARDESVEVRLGDHKFEPDTYADILTKGTYCTVDWQLGESRSRKELVSLEFKTIEIEGKIEEINDEYLVIKARPAGGAANWPDVVDDESRNTKAVPQRKLKLKILDAVTKYADRENNSLEVGDFAVGQSVEASVVYGRTLGYLAELRTPGEKRPRQPRPIEEESRSQPRPIKKPKSGGGGKQQGG